MQRLRASCIGAPLPVHSINVDSQSSLSRLDLFLLVSTVICYPPTAPTVTHVYPKVCYETPSSQHPLITGVWLSSTLGHSLRLALPVAGWLFRPSSIALSTLSDSVCLLFWSFVLPQFF